jgi:anti-sigma B factor antagonist
LKLSTVQTELASQTSGLVSFCYLYRDGNGMRAARAGHIEQIHKNTPIKMTASFQSRHDGDVTIIEVTGRLTFGDPAAALRELVAQTSRGKVVLDLGEVDYVDSAGLGELMHARMNCQLKLVNVTKRVADLLRLTGSYGLFDVQPNEAAAVTSFQQLPTFLSTGL